MLSSDPGNNEDQLAPIYAFRGLENMSEVAALIFLQ